MCYYRFNVQRLTKRFLFLHFVSVLHFSVNSVNVVSTVVCIFAPDYGFSAPLMDAAIVWYNVDFKSDILGRCHHLYVRG